jgi:CheY-like chemotaxis protein
MRILVVDDEAEVQRIREHLEPRGIEVAGTSSGDDALQNATWEQMMQIGEPLRTMVVEPLELPVEQPTGEPEPEPIQSPESEPEQVPVTP